MADATWYYEKEGEAIGPFKQSLITSFIKSGVITPETLVWEDGQEKQPAKVIFPDVEEKKLEPSATGASNASSIKSEAWPPPALMPDFIATAPTPPEYHNWTAAAAHPIRRFIARMIDTTIAISVFTMIFYTVILVGFSHLLIYAVLVFMPLLDSVPKVLWPYIVMGFGILLAFVSLMLLMPLCIRFFGTTPGKWALGLRVVNTGYGRPTWWQLMKREFSLSTVGSGFYFYYLCNIFYAWWCFSLMRHATTPWDNWAHTVTLYKRKSKLAMFLGCVLIFVVLAGFVALAIFAFGLAMAAARLSGMGG